MDKFREDFKDDFVFLDWLKSLSSKEREIYLSKSDVFEGEDPSMLNLSKEEFEEWVRKYNLHDAREWIEKFNNM